MYWIIYHVPHLPNMNKPHLAGVKCELGMWHHNRDPQLKSQFLRNPDLVAVSITKQSAGWRKLTRRKRQLEDKQKTGSAAIQDLLLYKYLAVENGGSQQQITKKKNLLTKKLCWLNLKSLLHDNSLKSLLHDNI